MGKKNYYVVKKGSKIGIFNNWSECQASVMGFKGAVYRGFETKIEALKWQNNQDGLTDQIETISQDKSCQSISPVDFEVYTDGSYINGRYSYGYAFIKDEQVVLESNGVGADLEAAKMRNVAGEIAAVQHAVERAKTMGVHICIYHDYSGISEWVNGNWQAKNKFTQAYVSYMRENRDYYELKKVTGHSGNRFNDYVDRLAKEALGIKP